MPLYEDVVNGMEALPTTVRIRSKGTDALTSNNVHAPKRDGYSMASKAKAQVSEITIDKKLTARKWPPCPVETTLTLIGSKWKVLVLRELMDGTKRFGELQRGVGNVSQKVLTSQLRSMEEDGLVHREVFAEVPPRVEYSLTPLGESLLPIIDSLRIWGEGFKAQLQ